MNTEKQKKILAREQKRNGGKIPDRIKLSPMFLLPEDAVIELWPELCQKCRDHCENNVHLASGREQQYIVSDLEMECQILSLNKDALMNVLLAEKGNGAKVMIEDIEIVEPKEFQHNYITIDALFKELDTDFYGRYDFNEIQK